MSQVELLRCTVEALPSATVVHVAGEIDLSTTGQLAQVIERAAEETDLVVDLDAVTYLDGAAIRLFDQFRRRWNDRRRGFVLACVPHQMRRKNKQRKMPSRHKRSMRRFR